MKKYIKYIAVIAVIVVITVILIIANSKKEGKSDNGTFKIVTSFYPIYIMAANITQGAENVELVNMADVNTGCIHNYTLTTTDMKQLEDADVFIQNGLGLENFIEKITTSNKNLQVIDSSEEIPNITQFVDAGEEVSTITQEVNPHIWTSIPNYIKQVEKITNELVQKNPQNESIYKTNSEEYIKKLTQLKKEYDENEAELVWQSAVSLNESLEYLGKELGLNLITVYTSHEESAISADTLKSVIETMKQNEIKIIIVDINDDLKNAQTIANETGAKIYKLNSGVTGSLNKDAYIDAMRGNLETLKIK